ncbi:MAG: ergothioneine biosynthesis protein EgtB [Methylotenera sp.]|uniref:ergothioneine biosynthesis protein EgtB n=1 Tax=Methylotenera sp. TaxID=2051956 RepID=UPI002720E1F9|nr:ergothioneine biosynthesis protein EgtB [Methylotenera sp.]MDO9151199.1 ergothioneine biosynthesis protein EgtB [Methylotenera sp.]
MNHALTLPDECTQESFLHRYQMVRSKSLDICKYIEIEDYAVQPMADVSPPKWHLGHTTWFFEELLLVRFYPGYQRFHAQYSALFNSYYKSLGTHTLQANRGNLSRPTVDQIIEYRSYVDVSLVRFISEHTLTDEMKFLIEAGLHHEQQHQELLYMDVKFILASNIIDTQYAVQPLQAAPEPIHGWSEFAQGLYQIGHDAEGFAYDNEKPAHQYYLYPFAISQTLATNGEFLAFIKDHGYTKPEYWLSQGWDWVNQQHIQQPLYWSCRDGEWYECTLYGLIPLDLNRPLVHISYFEANAFANWKKLRLPTEQELEVFLNQTSLTAEFAHTTLLHPNNAQNMYGEVWCWTSSQYSAYPRFKTFDGILNEYNGKFMCNQFVLRGGCVATPDHHYRHSYRNFYQPQQRWMFSGIRLAKDIV